MQNLENKNESETNVITKSIPKESKEKECNATIWKRNCPECNREIYHKNYRSYLWSLKNNKICNSCSHIGKQVWNKGLTKETSESVNKHSYNLSNYIKNYGPWNKGLTKSTDTRVKDNIDKMSKGLIKYYKTHDVWNKGKNHPKVKGDLSSNKRPEVRRKLRESCLKKRNGLFGIDIEACLIFDKIDEVMKWNGQYGTKFGEKEICGYVVDYFNEDQKLIIEWDDYEHFKSRNIKKDIVRQENILNEIGKNWIILRWNEKKKIWRTDLMINLHLLSEQTFKIITDEIYKNI